MAGASLKGADSLVRTLGDAADTLADLTEPDRDAGQLLTEAAQKASPRRSGQLADSHGYTVTSAGVEVYAAAPYAALVHARKPWLADVLAANEDAVLDRYEAHADKALGQVKGT